MPTGFASDNYAPAHPAAIAAVIAANAGHAPAYGADPWTARLDGAIRDAFGERATAWPVFNGTGANVLALAAVCRPWDSVICTTDAHLHTDECGAPEAVAGLKLLPVASEHAKLTPEAIAHVVDAPQSEHQRRPRVVSITQSTELGTVYTPNEVGALADAAHTRGLLLHVDGARLFNAAVALGVEPRAITSDVGVDLLSLGGTKVGLLGAEAVVVMGDVVEAEALRYGRKLTMQLASKLRYASAQLLALLEQRLWVESAGNANAMATRLADGVRDVPGVELTHPVQANGVFALLPRAATVRLQERWPFYVWRVATGEVRWLCAWDTRAEEVDAFTREIAAAVAVAS